MRRKMDDVTDTGKTIPVWEAVAELELKGLTREEIRMALRFVADEIQREQEQRT